ncbi:MAG: caspase family protein [Rhodospirillales bacterium]|nr:caspase family protein [Rhodospirillales bacterium]
MLIAAQAMFGAGASRAAEGPNLPAAKYKPLPVGTKIVYDNAIFTVAKAEGYTTVFKKQVGGTTTWLNTHALFGEYADDMFATRQRDQVFYDIKSEDMKSLERFWPLEIGKKVQFAIQEESRAAYSHADQWRITLTVAGTETLNLGGKAYATYVLEESGGDGEGSSFTGRKWYHPPSGLIVRSTRTWTKVGKSNFRRLKASEGDQEDFSLVEAAFPKGTTASVLARAPATPAAVPAAPAPAIAQTPPAGQGTGADAGSALPPAEYKPLPVGTKIEYDNATYIIAKRDGYATVLKKQVRGTTTWVSRHALFGEYGTDLHVRGARGQGVEYDLSDENRKALERLWPLAIGKETTYRLSEAAMGSYGGAAQEWTVTLKVSTTEAVETAGGRFQTYVIEERAESDLGMSFAGRKWYDPASGLIVRLQRTGTGLNAVGDLAWYPKTAQLGKDEQEMLALRKVDFPPGTAAVLVAAAQGTAAGGKPTVTVDKPQVAKAEPARRPAPEARQAAEAKAREAEIAQLKQEAEKVLKAREAEMAKRLKQADEAHKAREAEIAKLKQEAEQALKAREAEISRLRQTLAEHRDDKAGDTGSAFSGIEFGRYHALVIGIDNYKHLPKLNTAVNDARGVAEVLEKDYGFIVTLLLEPTRNDIIDALDAYREKLDRNDNLLIYYAGHGWLDREVDRGYWLPIDAEPKRRRDWVSNATITDTLKALSAKHVMVVADSCYSGTLVRGADMGTRTRTGDYWKQMATKFARVAITSGGLEPVADAGGGGHSPFAKAFISALGDNAAVMDGTQLFSQMRRPVMVNARQTPQYADVREAGHDGGDFLFVRKKK